MAAVQDEDDLPPLVGEDGAEVEDDLPPLVGEQAPEAEDPPRGEEPGAEAPSPISATTVAGDGAETVITSKLPEGMSPEDALKATAALQAAAALEAAGRVDAEDGEVDTASATGAIKGALAEAQEPRTEHKEPDEKTKRMVMAISKDDFEECEDAILQGADVNVDCGAGMHALHISALRGEMFLTELLIAHEADVNVRDLSGNTPLLYTCHFYRQHGKGVQLVSQLLYHKADPFFRCKDGKFAGKSAHDIMDQARKEPNTDESVPINMCAMLQLAMDGGESGFEAITKVWMQSKSQNKKLYTVSSKKDSYDYAMKNIAWVTPANAKNAQACAPVKLEGAEDSILEEKFTYLKDYLFNDEGDKVKVYVNFPDSAISALSDREALRIDFEIQALDLKLKTASESFRLRIEPLFGTIDVEQCKHRVSASSGKVTLTLTKRHKNRIWSAIQKSR